MAGRATPPGGRGRPGGRDRVRGAAPGGDAAGDVPADAAGLCLRSGALGIGLAVALVAVGVVMVAKP